MRASWLELGRYLARPEVDFVCTLLLWGVEVPKTWDLGLGLTLTLEPFSRAAIPWPIGDSIVGHFDADAWGFPSPTPR